MTFRNIVQRTLGLLLLLLLLAVDGVVMQIAPTETEAMYAVVSMTLLAVACVVAGYFLRTYWALLIVPVVTLGGAYLFGVLSIFKEPKFYFVDAVLLVMFSIVIALLALLGVLLGKRSARIVTMTFRNIVQRTLGLILLLLLLAVDGVVMQIVPTEAGAVSAVVSMTLLAVACVVAGYFLRTFLAVLIVPFVFLGGAFLSGVFTISPKPELFFFEIIFLFNVMISIVIALLALLGVLLGKRSARRRSARTGAALAAS